MLPYVYTPYMVDKIFKNAEKKNFYSLCLHVYAFRLYLSGLDVTNPKMPALTQANFAKLVTTAFPERL